MREKWKVERDGKGSLTNRHIIWKRDRLIYLVKSSEIRNCFYQLHCAVNYSLLQTTISGLNMRTLRPLVIALVMLVSTSAMGIEVSSESGEVLDLDKVLQEVAVMKTDMIQLKSEMQHLKDENCDQKSEIMGIRKKNNDLTSEVIELTKVVSSHMDPHLKEQLVSNLEVRSIEDDVQENKEDIIDLRINDGHHDMQLSEMLNQITNINTTLHAEIVKIGERLTNIEELGSGLQEEVDTIKADVNNIQAEINIIETDIKTIKSEIEVIDGRLSKSVERTAVCGYLASKGFTSSTILNYDRVYDEVDSTGGSLNLNGYFTAGIEGIYYVTLETLVDIDDGEYLHGVLETSSGNYSEDGDFTHSVNTGGGGGPIRDQASASRYLKLVAGESLHINLVPGLNSGGREVYVGHATMCVSLYSPSD